MSREDLLPPRALLTAFLLEEIAKQPTERRVLLYRAMSADDRVDATLRAECAARASEYEAVLRREDQMILDFRRRVS